MNMTKRAERVAIVGLDAAAVPLVQRFMAQGRMPHTAALARRGQFFTQIHAMFPTLTPTNWATIATGARPAEHQIADFHVHVPGTPLNEAASGFDARLCRAETLWEAAGRQGKRTALLKYPGSWPALEFAGVTVDGCLPNCRHQLLREHVFVAGTPRLATAEETGAWFVNDPESWRLVRLEPTASGTTRRATGTLRPREGEPATVEFELGSDAVEIRFAGGSESVARGGWSSWFDVRCGDTAGLRTRVRFKVMALQNGGRDAAIFATAGMPATGYTRPEGLAEELFDAIPGAFIQGPAVGPAEARWIDPETFCEVAELQCAWYAAAGRRLLATQRPDLFAMQMHATDHAAHLWLNLADPATAPDAETAARYDALFGRVYAACDSVVGAIVEAAGSDTAVAVVGDHGVQSYSRLIFEEQGWDRAYPARRILREAGLITMRPGADGREEVDWSRTRAYPTTDVHVFVNLRGRDPDGIVAPGAEYEQVVNEIVTALRGYVDPQSGQAPFATVLPKRDAAVLGQGGSTCGDVIYAIDPPFAYIHGQQLPTSKHGMSDQRPAVIVGGAGIEAGGESDQPGDLRDMAATAANLLGIEPPKQSTGRTLTD